MSYLPGLSLISKDTEITNQNTKFINLDNTNNGPPVFTAGLAGDNLTTNTSMITQYAHGVFESLSIKDQSNLMLNKGDSSFLYLDTDGNVKSKLFEDLNTDIRNFMGPQGVSIYPDILFHILNDSNNNVNLSLATNHHYILSTSNITVSNLNRGQEGTIIIKSTVNDNLNIENKDSQRNLVIYKKSTNLSVEDNCIYQLKYYCISDIELLIDLSLKYV